MSSTSRLLRVLNPHGNTRRAGPMQVATVHQPSIAAQRLPTAGPTSSEQPSGGVGVVVVEGASAS